MIAPMTKDEALIEGTFHYTGNGECKKITGPRGGVSYRIVRVRRNGYTQTWKTRPEEWSLPIKFGLKNAFRITQNDAPFYHPADRCPIEDARY